MERLILLHKEKHPDKCLELRATVDGKRMYERLGFSVFREIHEASEGDLYDMHLYHWRVWLQTRKWKPDIGKNSHEKEH